VGTIVAGGTLVMLPVLVFSIFLHPYLARAHGRRCQGVTLPGTAGVSATAASAVSMRKVKLSCR
jgi:hypothetical protein